MDRPGLKQKFLSFLKKQSFQPSRLSILFHPFYFIRRDLYKHIRRQVPVLSGKLLDFGCGRKPYQNLFSVNSYTGVDVENTGHNHSLSKVDVYYDGKHLPFGDASFDALFCSEVLEHVFNPDEILPEIRRVLKQGSQVLITTPFCWNEHEVPFDYARYSSFGMIHLLEKNGFRVKKLIKSGHFSVVYFQLGALYFYEIFKKYGTAGKVLAQLFITPINLIGTMISAILPRNRSLYFNNVIIAEKC
jgi:SAM-dependent methyltransferase